MASVSCRWCKRIYTADDWDKFGGSCPICKCGSCRILGQYDRGEALEDIRRLEQELAYLEGQRDWYIRAVAAVKARIEVMWKEAQA
jgi:hypothetical protein